MSANIKLKLGLQDFGFLRQQKLELQDHSSRNGPVAAPLSQNTVLGTGILPSKSNRMQGQPPSKRRDYRSTQSTSGETRTAPIKPTPPTHTPDYISTITERAKSDIVKKEAGKPEKVPQQRKKRGQYKKTILRQQAEAAAAAAAAGLPPPVFPPLTLNSPAKGKARATEAPTTATVESLNVLSHKPSHGNATSGDTSEMERELQMLAEEAEEDKRRREEEAADRILKRAQVVKHLRSLKSKLATAQIQIGQDLHYQSVDLFSQLYDEVLEDIGKDNSEMLELLKNSHPDQSTHDSDRDDAGSSSTYPGHMLTRSSDKPKKRDLISTITSTSVSAAKGYQSDEHIRTSHMSRHDGDSDNEGAAFRRYRRPKSSGQYIGQSWNIGSGADDTSTAMAPSSSNRKLNTNFGKSKVVDLEDEDDDKSSPRKHLSKGAGEVTSPSETREELQLRHRQELEELQRQQRTEQEEFQRKQLDQLRQLQERQSQEFQEFEDMKAKMYQEHLEGLAEKRLKLSQSQYSRSSDIPSSRYRRTESYSVNTHSYDSESGLRTHDHDHTSSHSRTSSPIPQRVAKQSRTHQGSSTQQSSIADQTFSTLSLKTSTSSSSALYSQHLSKARTQGVNGGLDTLPMSTMTLALTAMNEKKKQMKRAMKKQMGQEGTQDRTQESSDDEENHAPSRLLSPPIWSQKRSVFEDGTEIKRRPSVGHSQSTARSSIPNGLNRPQKIAESATFSQSQFQSHTTSATQPGSLSHPICSVEDSRSLKTKGRKRKNPLQLSPQDPAHDIASEPGKSAMGFNKTLLSHFEKWNPDEKTENFFDFVLSDPPDIDVDDSEVEGLLKREGRASGNSHQELNATPTSNAFRWYQEQQKLAQELAQQPKIAPLRLVDDDDDGHEHSSAGKTSGFSTAGMSDAAQLSLHSHGTGSLGHELIPGEDPLAAFIQTTKKSDTRHGTPSHQSNGAESRGLPSTAMQDSSPFLTSSPGPNMLFSEDGVEDWDFSPFPADATDEYLNHDSPMQTSGEYDHLDF
ncbi:hypothetical protein BGX28_006323 [Mortierella sp. GBA30]|nr:hypothetical protein BGX28_006323 [Mortierella sp. GBA30]